MQRRRQVVFLAICSGDDHLISAWARSGDLPAIARLMAEGRVGRTHGLPRNEAVKVYVDGEMVPRDKAVVSVFNSGFVLGDGVWEGFRGW